MTATVDPRAVTQVRAPAPGALGRAEGVELLGDVHGSGYKEGAALVRRADGQMVQLGPLMYAVLAEADGRRSLAELAEALSARFGRRFDETHVRRLAEKLAAQGLLSGTEHRAPPRRNPLLALRWKVLVTNPQTTRRLTAPFAFLFRPWVMWPVVACFAGVFWFVLVRKGISSATAQAFHSPGLLLLVFVLAVASAGFHELGHAAACRYGGGTPGGMGMGIYMVWPAFYTDVTDAYRLPQRARLRIDLGGLYFNAIVAVLTMAAWLAWRVDALLLLIALQILQMVRQLSPVIRADGYHILSDATGVPDLYAHIGPTLRRLLPGHRHEPSALRGRARVLVTLWVLIVVPVLLSLLVGAMILLPRLLTSTWDSGRTIVDGIGHTSTLGILASLIRLLALILPVAGSILVTQKVVRNMTRKALAWTHGRPARRGALVAVLAAALAGTAWALWPSGQYRPVRANDSGTIGGFGRLLAAPENTARPPVATVPPTRPAAPAQAAAAAPARVQLTPGRHLAVAAIPRGGATKAHPALFVIEGRNGDPALAILSATSPDPASAPTAATPVQTTTATTPTTTTTTTPATTTGSSVQNPSPVAATAFPFKPPAPPGPGGTQAVAVNTHDGAVVYDIAYAIVTIANGAPVTNTNGAFAFANCNACTTVAVSFQIVLIVGQSNKIAPIDAAGALNVNCPSCLTTAIADQIVVTLTAQPSPELVAKLQAALQQLNALPLLGANGSPAAVAAEVAAVQSAIDTELKNSGLLANATSTTATTTTATATTTPTATTPPTTTSATTAATTTAPTPTTTPATTPGTTTPTTAASAATPTPTPTSTATTSTTTMPAPAASSGTPASTTTTPTTTTMPTTSTQSPTPTTSAATTPTTTTPTTTATTTTSPTTTTATTTAPAETTAG